MQNWDKSDVLLVVAWPLKLNHDQAVEAFRVVRLLRTTET